MQNIYKKLFLIILSTSLVSLSSCIKLPEENIWIDPIFIEEKNKNTQNSEIWDFEKISDNIKTSTWEIVIETSTWEVLNENTQTWVTTKNKTSTGEIINHTWTWITTPQSSTWENL
jgi:hypothetical protein